MYSLALEPDMEATTLYSIRPHIEVAADHRLAGQDSVRLADLADEPMVMFVMQPNDTYMQSVYAAAGVTPNVKMKMSSVEAVRALVASGAGYSVLLQRSAGRMSYTGHPFTICEIEEDVGSVPVQLVRHGTSRLTRRAEAFSDFCRLRLDTMRQRVPGR
jgi:DNA-binding transcriptional LysR family regulator